MVNSNKHVDPSDGRLQLHHGFGQINTPGKRIQGQITLLDDTGWTHSSNNSVVPYFKVTKINFS